MMKDPALLILDREGSDQWRSPHRLPQRHQERSVGGRPDGQSHLFQRRHQRDQRPKRGEVINMLPFSFSGSIRQTLNAALLCAQIYFYAEAQTTHITYPDGIEVLHFPNNQTGR